MSHEIEEFADGTAAFAMHRTSERDVPWHRLGTWVDHAMSLDEVLALAQLDWRVTIEPLYASGPSPAAAPNVVRVPGRYATMRRHPKTGAYDVLGDVGERYEVVQTRDAGGFLDEVQGVAPYETAGSLKNGRRVFITQKLNEGITLDPNGAADQVDLYLISTNSFDGTTSFEVAVTPVRVVCQNTLNFALRGARSRWATRHTVRVNERVEAARQVLGIAESYKAKFEATARTLIESAFSADDFESLLEDIVPIPEEARDSTKDRVEDKRDELRHLFDNATTQENVRGTAWAAYNAIAEYGDWFKPVNGVKSEEAFAERKMLDSLGGPLDRFKQDAFDRVLAKVAA